MNKIFVNCGGSLYQYDSKKDVMDFFEDCIYGSEGSERESYNLEKLWGDMPRINVEGMLAK